MHETLRISAFAAFVVTVAACGNTTSSFDPSGAPHAPEPPADAPPPRVARGGESASCVSDVDCGPGFRCARSRAGEFQSGACVSTASAVNATASADAGTTAAPDADSSATDASVVVTDAGVAPSVQATSCGGPGAELAGATWVGNQSPAQRDASDDGAGAAARFGYVIAMRYAPATDTLWVNDGRIRTVDASGNVTTRFTPHGSGYANLGVDSAGNGWVYDAPSAKKIDATSGVVSATLPVTRPAAPASWTFMTLNVGADDHVYAFFIDQHSPTNIDAYLIDVTDSSKVALQTTLLSVPTDFAVDAGGHVWVADPNDQQARRFDLGTGAEQDLFAKSECTVFAVALDAHGDFYVGPAKYASNGAPLLRTARPFAYGLAASTTKIWFPECTYTANAGWGCALRVVTQ